jgi:hypothetical protein
MTVLLALLTSLLFQHTFAIYLQNATVPVRVQFTTCDSSGSGSSSSSIYISFPSVPSFKAQKLTSVPYYTSTTYNQVFFLDEYPSNLNLTSRTTDSLCLTALIVNDYQVSFPQGNVWLDYPCSDTYPNNEICQGTYIWTFPQVTYGITSYGVQVEFTTCSNSASGSSDYFYVSFPSLPSFPSTRVSQDFTYPSTTYSQGFYPMTTLPTDFKFTSQTSDALCLSGITMNGISLNFTTNIWFDSPCSGSYGTNGNEPCYTSFTWSDIANITAYGEILYYFYHTCSYSDSSSGSVYFYVSFPSISSYLPDTLSWTFSSTSNWFYQQYYLPSSTPSDDLKILADTSDEICLDSIRFNEHEAMYQKKSHYYLDNPCSSSSYTSKNYSNYCSKSVTWTVNKTTQSGDSDDDMITVDDIQFLITGAMICALVTLALMVVGLILCCCYVHAPASRQYLGKDEVVSRQSTTNPLNSSLLVASGDNKGKKTVVVPPLELRLNATSGAPQADAINQEYDHIIRLALQDVALLAENDQVYLIGKIRFSISSSKITKTIEFLTITILGGVAITINTCPTWFCKVYLVISCYLWFLTVLLRFESYPLSRPTPPKPIERRIYQLVVAERVSRYQDRIYYDWNKNGQSIRIYEEPEMGTKEVQQAQEFQKYQQTLKKQNRLSGPVFQFTPREWSKERAEAKASVEEINSRNLALAREENQKRELKQQEMDRDRHERDKNNLESYRQSMIRHELSITGWEVAMSYLYCLISFCTMVLFVVGLFWNVSCTGTGSVLCNFIVFPTVVFEFMFIITYTKREKMNFEARREAVINV